MPATTIFLVRHGETEWNAGNIFRGTHDIPLNDNGRRQARSLTESFRVRPTQAAYTSPLSRAVETAQLALGGQGPTTVVDERLTDFCYGDWTGLDESEVARRWPDELKIWKDHPHQLRVPGGNTLAEVSEKAGQAMDELSAKHAGQTIALFAHRVVNKLLVLGALRLGLERFNYLRQDNCCLNEFERGDGGTIVVSLNDTCHLRQTGVPVLATDF